jgi:hypothetical protein
MHIFKIFPFIFLSFLSYGQLIDGTLVDTRRRLLSETDFKIKSNFEGEVYFEISVNPEGEVTNTRFITSMTTTNSTPARIEAQNQVKKLEFESGTHFPKFQHARVKMTLVKE